MLRQISKTLMISLSTITPTIAIASPVGVDEAKEIAYEFFDASGISRLTDPASLELLQPTGITGLSHYYVFNATDGHGFIIISADDCATPVLAYSEDGSYSAATAPAAMNWLLSGLDSEVAMAPKYGQSKTSQNRRSLARKAARADERILLKTAQWRQEEPFNYSIPGHPLVGCVGTAMGIVMKYHNHPERGTGSYTTNKGTVNFDVAYDWANMREDNYRSSYTQVEADAVSTLLYHTSAAIGTQWGYSGSSAYEARVPAAMSRYFGYDPGISYKKRSEVSNQAAFDAIIADEIRNGRPVIFCGQDVTEGHAFVVDGYDPANGMLHINWGWGGSDGNLNGGWYASTALNPTVSVSHNFNNLATIIYNIKPSTTSIDYWSPIHITADGSQTGIGSDVTTLMAGNAFNVRVGNLKNVSYDDFSGHIAVALFDASGVFKSLLSGKKNFELSGMTGEKYMLFDGYMDFSGCALPADVTVADGDVIRISTSADGGITWLPVPGELITVNEIPASRTEAEGFAITLPSVSGVSINGAAKVVRGWDYSFSVTPSDPASQVVTVKANGYVLTPDANYRYTVRNVREDQEISVLVQDASEVIAKRSVWVETPGTLKDVLTEAEAAAVKDLTLFGSIDASDFEYMRSGMRLERLDISSVYIAANGSNQACALPRNAFLNQGQLREVVLPSNLTRINNGAFRSSGITSIVIPAGVSTYEYNVFLSCSHLRHIWVGREKAEFINWCVLEGTNKSAITLHVPSQAALANYTSKENWKDITNVVVEQYPAPTDFLLAVQHNSEVRFDCETATLPTRYSKGHTVTFAAKHIADNDNRMEVYANNMLLSPDADGNYTTTVNANTLIHFNLVNPEPVNSYASDMQLTNTGGTVGLFTDVVNVFPGTPFTIRANAFNVPASMGSFFWAAVLTDAAGNIKEFISPVSTWNSSIVGDGLKMNVKCCVSLSSVREGNMIRLATSYNKKTWSLVKGKTHDVIDALPALNNQTPVYNITFPDLPNANVSGVVATAVHGRDITITVSPKNVRDHINMTINGEVYATGATTVKYSFIAKQDMNFDVEVVTPPVPEVKTYTAVYDTNIYKCETFQKLLLADLNAGALPEKVILKGRTYVSDISQTFCSEDGIRNRIKSIDMSELVLIDKSSGSPVEYTKLPQRAFGSAYEVNTVLEQVILPNNITQLEEESLGYCTGLREITLPEGVKGQPTQGGEYALARRVFMESLNINTIYITSRLESKEYSVGTMVYFNHFNPYNQNGKRYASNKLFGDAGIEPNVTVIVPKEDYEYYTDDSKSYNEFTNTWCGNPWMLDGYNILTEKPVYSLNFDPSRLRAAEDLDIDNINFLGENIKEATISTSGRLFLSDDAPEKVRIYDNDKLLGSEAVGEDRSVNIVFHNPNTGNGLHGNHDVRVEYFHDVNFTLSSDVFEISESSIQLSGVETLTPIAEWVAENSNLRFKIGMKHDNPDIVAKVKLNGQVVDSDEEGYYNIAVTDYDPEIEVYAVPMNGAVISAEEFTSLDVKEAVDVTSISLTGDVSEDIIATVAGAENFQSLEELNLSNMTSALQENAFAGAEKLRVITLPDNIESIPAGIFSDCTNLTTVTVPETVSNIGAGAFAGCSSLESVTLVGIDGIGPKAFSGCSAMKVIYINAATQAPAAQIKARKSEVRASGYDDKAFDGLNPNCIIVLGENVSKPSAPGNYVSTLISTIRDIDADGNEISREGRVYTTASDITLNAGYEFSTPYTFNIDHSVSLTLNVAPYMEKGGWSPLVAPFNIHIDANPELENFEIYIADETESFAKTTEVEAYTPALIRRANGATSGDLTLYANNRLSVSATPETMTAEGHGFTLVASMKTAKADASTAFIINEEGSAFSSVLSDALSTQSEDETGTAVVDVQPFSVYAVSDSNNPEIKISRNNATSAVESVELAEGMHIYARGGVLTIESEGTVTLPVYDASGRICRMLDLHAGSNMINGLEHGKVYVIGNFKIVF